MSAEQDRDTLARVVALEYAFSAFALMTAGNFAMANGLPVADTVARYKDAAISAMFDESQGTDAREMIVGHLKRLFDHIESMARTLDQGPSA